MSPHERTELAHTLLETTGTLVGIAVSASQAGPLATTVVQQRVLNLIAELGPLTINQLAELLTIDQSTASRHCSRLEELGAAARVRLDADLRSVQIELTDLGVDQVAAVRAARLAAIDQILANIDDDRPLHAVDTLRRFNRASRPPHPQNRTHPWPHATSD